MGLFDKKYCSICGEKIGFLGNRKLEDGNLCKNCSAKLSPWFSDRRSSTVEERLMSLPTSSTWYPLRASAWPRFCATVLFPLPPRPKKQMRCAISPASLLFRYSFPV